MPARPMVTGSVESEETVKIFLAVAQSSEIVNRNFKFWSSLISQCVLSSRTQWALENIYFIFWKGKELKAAWTIFLYVDENFSHSFQNQSFAIHLQTWCPLPMPFLHNRTEQQSVITSLGHYNWPIKCLS